MSPQGRRGLIIGVAMIAGFFLSGRTAYFAVSFFSQRPPTSESAADWLGFFFSLLGLPAGLAGGNWAANATDVGTTLERLGMLMIYIVIGTALSIFGLGILEVVTTLQPSHR